MEIAVNEFTKENREKRIAFGFPFIEAEVIFAARHDWAIHAEDIIARRTRLAFINKESAISAIPRVVELMGQELKWTEIQKQIEIEKCQTFMNTFGGPIPMIESN